MTTGVTVLGLGMASSLPVQESIVNIDGFRIHLVFQCPGISDLIISSDESSLGWVSVPITPTFFEFGIPLEFIKSTSHTDNFSNYIGDLRRATRI